MSSRSANVPGEVAARLAPWLARWNLAAPTALADWFATMRLLEFEPEALLIRQGEPSTQLFLLDEGLVRLYYLTAEGSERNKAFIQAGQITGAVSAAITDRPAPFSIQALQPTFAIAADYAPLRRLADHNHAISQLFIELLSQAFVRNEEREAMLLTLSPKERYRWVERHEPELLTAVPQFHIASYLGIDPVSLSRIRRRIRDEEQDAGGSAGSH